MTKAMTKAKCFAGMLTPSKWISLHKPEDRPFDGDIETICSQAARRGDGVHLMRGQPSNPLFSTPVYAVVVGNP